MTVIKRALDAQIMQPKAVVEQTFAEVVLGRASAKCKHLGICKIENAESNNFFDYGMGNSSGNRLYAVANWQQGVYFELEFSRSTVSPDVFDKYFASGTFRMEESYTTDADLLGKSICIAKGKYRVKLTNSLISVRFGLG